jgi:hypothetical protein
MRKGLGRFETFYFSGAARIKYERSPIASWNCGEIKSADIRGISRKENKRIKELYHCPGRGRVFGAEMRRRPMSVSGKHRKHNTIGHFALQ